MFARDNPLISKSDQLLSAGGDCPTLLGGGIVVVQEKEFAARVLDTKALKLGQALFK
jgi:hypothetical protein